jgi:hypothetical protein
MIEEDDEINLSHMRVMETELCGGYSAVYHVFLSCINICISTNMISEYRRISAQQEVVRLHARLHYARLEQV